MEEHRWKMSSENRVLRTVSGQWRDGIAGRQEKTA
jgi:hypothetical protein